MEPLKGSEQRLEKKSKKAVWYAPTFLLGAFLIVFTGLFVMHNQFSLEHRQDHIRQAAGQASSEIVHHLEVNRQYLLLLAEKMGEGSLEETQFRELTSQYLTEHAELIKVIWADSEFIIRWTAPYDPEKVAAGFKLTLPEKELAPLFVRDKGKPVWTRSFKIFQNEMAFGFYVPVFRGGEFLGTIGGIYTAEKIFQNTIPQLIYKKYHLSLADETGKVIYGLPLKRELDGRFVHRVPLEQPGDGVSLVMTGYMQKIPLNIIVLGSLCAVLSIGFIWSTLRMKRELYGRMRAERDLQASEERYREIFNRSRDCIFINDFEGNFIDANPAALNLLGYTKEEITSLNYGSLLSEDRLAEAFNLMEKTIEKGEQSIIHEYTIKKKTGDSVCVESQGALIYINGKPFAIMGIARDITQRKLADKALKKSEYHYRLLAENVSDIIFTMDMDMNFTYFSPSVTRLLGFTVEEALSRSVDKIMTQASFKIVAKTITEEIEKYKKGQRPPDKSNKLEVELFCKDGSTIWSEVEANFVYDDNTHPQNIIGVARDITERRRAEEDRRKLEAQIQEAYKMEAIATLTGGVAHDINNILGIILTNTELALDDVPEWNPAYLSLEDIQVATLRASDIVKQLLSFSRKTDQELRPVGVMRLIKDALRFLRSTIPTTVEIRKHFPPAEEMILADSVQINQVMMNLFINASQEMAETGGILEITAEKVILDEDAEKGYTGLSKGDYIKITVSDTGPGIDPEIIDRIFEPYFSTKEIGKGSGMGLAVVHGIVKKHNGTIAVESEPGKGTAFKILFPVIAKKPEIKTERTDTLPFGNEKLLFVDDEESIVNGTGQMLTRLGYQVQTTTNPVEALELFQLKPDQFDLAITDMTMPQMTGINLSERLMEIRSDIPVIICTGHSPLVDEEKAKAMGIAAYVMKPIIKQDIAVTIRKVLDNKKSSC